MTEDTPQQSFLCSSADWSIVVDNADSFESAASRALEQLLESDGDKFSVGAVISVIPIKKSLSETRLIYAPAVLADIGMHKYAAELIKHIDQDE
jgi:hypothetical protein